MGSCPRFTEEFWVEAAKNGNRPIFNRGASRGQYTQIVRRFSAVQWPNK
jgi:hypothetical protein